MELITRKELKEVLKLSVPTIMKLEEQGLVPRIQIGNKIFYDKDEIWKNIEFLKKSQNPSLIKHLKTV